MAKPYVTAYGLALWTLSLLACGAVETSPPPSTVAPSALGIDPPPGIVDPGDDPAVVSIETTVEGKRAVLCAGALIAPDVVLTARHCVVRPNSVSTSTTCVENAALLRDATALEVRTVGDAQSSAPEALGRSILVPQTPDPCDGDVAIVMLDRTIDGVAPLLVRPTGVALGDHVRTVSFAQRAAASQEAIVFDHVEVTAGNSIAFRLDEGPCEDGCGGPVVDESTSQIVGVLSEATKAAESDAGTPMPAGDVATRTDAFPELVQKALDQGAPTKTGRKAKTKKGPIDIGADCARAEDCAAGVCVTDGSRRYCSRTCATHDHCPVRFRCEKNSGRDGPRLACVES